MRNCSFLLLACLIVAQNSHALFTSASAFLFFDVIPRAEITEDQWTTYEQGTLNVYESLFGEDKTKDMLAKMKKVGQDVLLIWDHFGYLGHVFFKEETLANETIIRVGMFGTKDEVYAPRLPSLLIKELKNKCQQYDFACGCPAAQMSSLGLTLKKAGFVEDETVAGDSKEMMDNYGIDTTTPGQYYWFRLKNKGPF